MKREVRCGFCDKLLGSFHHYQVQGVITRHFKKVHPDEYQEMIEAKATMDFLLKKYSYGGYL